MSKFTEMIDSITRNILFFIFLIFYFGNFPLAIIFGDKKDVILSFFIPGRGVWVMLRSVFFS